MPHASLENTDLFVAHTPSKANPYWHGLTDHALAVTALATEFARPFGGEILARYVGPLHDLGKLSRGTVKEAGGVAPA